MGYCFPAKEQVIFVNGDEATDQNWSPSGWPKLLTALYYSHIHIHVKVIWTEINKVMETTTTGHVCFATHSRLKLQTLKRLAGCHGKEAHSNKAMMSLKSNLIPHSLTPAAVSRGEMIRTQYLCKCSIPFPRVTLLTVTGPASVMHF